MEQTNQQLPDAGNKVDVDLRSDQGTDRLLEVYNQILESEDITYKTAALLTISNHYGYALTISNGLNGRQGKNRATIQNGSFELMGYSMDSDVDEILDKRVTDLFVDILNTYLVDKQVLPVDKPKAAAGMLSRVKALFIMLISTNQYSVIPVLNIPPYMLGMVTSIFDVLAEIKDTVLDDWIKYLEESGNQEMADIVKSVGNEFWGSEGIKANVIYDRYFSHMADRIKEPIKTYEAYKKFRASYRKTTKNIVPSKIYDIFEISPDAYNRARLNVYNEITTLFPNDEDIKVSQRLIFG